MRVSDAMSREVRIANSNQRISEAAKMMSTEVKYCFEDEDLVHVSKNMAELQLRRLPVVNRDKRLVGILALADIAVVEGARTTGRAVEGITRPGGKHHS